MGVGVYVCAGVCGCCSCGKAQALKAQVVCLCCLFLHLGKTARHAPQRSTVEVRNGWLQIIRGPRPPAAKWPRAKVQSTPTQQKPSATVAHRQQLPKSQTFQMHDRPRRSPAEVRAVASTKVLRTKAAIASLGADDIEERTSSEAALSRAQRLLVVLQSTSASKIRHHSLHG